VIAQLRGPVVALTSTSAVIECGGVGLAVVLTPKARDLLRLGEEAVLPTRLVVREDSLTLYGFASTLERDVFTTAQSVSGVGPRLALALVSTLGAEELIRAVNSEDVAALTRVSGIGRKGAQKLVISLSGKLGPSSERTTAGVPGAGNPGTGSPGAVATDVQSALESLGWAPAAAANAITTVLSSPDAPADAPGLLRAALRTLGPER
jgi:Holliday junction DNA helicase RuvA